MLHGSSHAANAAAFGLHGDADRRVFLSQRRTPEDAASSPKLGAVTFASSEASQASIIATSLAAAAPVLPYNPRLRRKVSGDKGLEGLGPARLIAMQPRGHYPITVGASGAASTKTVASGCFILAMFLHIGLTSIIIMFAVFRFSVVIASVAVIVLITNAYSCYHTFILA